MNGNATRLRAELALLLARYDHGAVAPSTYAIIRSIEIDIAWIEHRSRESGIAANSATN